MELEVARSFLISKQFLLKTGRVKENVHLSDLIPAEVRLKGWYYYYY